MKHPKPAGQPSTLSAQTNKTATENQLWDKIIKTIAHKMPNHLLPLIKEAFQKEYLPDTPIRLLSTEYLPQGKNLNLEPNKKGRQKYPSIFTDIVLQVGPHDIYHIESQMKNDSSMAIRMVEYSFNIALQHSTYQESENSRIVLELPRSCVIYLEPNQNIPDHLLCTFKLPDGSSFEYKIPAIRVQSYPLSEISEKHLFVLVPFLLLRFRPRLKSKMKPLAVTELTDYLKELIVIVNREHESGGITDSQVNDYAKMIYMAGMQIFANDQQLSMEVERMMDLIELPSDKIKQKDSQIKRQALQLKQKDAQIRKLQKKNKELSAYIAQLTRLKSSDN